MLYVFKTYLCNDPEVLKSYLEDTQLTKAQSISDENNTKRYFEQTIRASPLTSQATYFRIVEKKSFSSVQLSIFVDWCQLNTLNQCHLVGSDLKPIEKVAENDSSPPLHLPTGSEISGVYYGDLNQDALPEVLIVLNTGIGWLFESKPIEEPATPPPPTLSPGLSFFKRCLFKNSNRIFQWLFSLSDEIISLKP